MFRLLGPIEVRAGDDLLDVGPPQQRTVLAALLVDAGHIVTAEMLVDRVWGHAPPAGVRSSLHAHVARIRRMLKRAALASGAAAELVLRSGGYVLDIDPQRVDIHRFTRLLKAASDGHRPEHEQLTLLREALGLWRGEPLVGLSGDWVERVRNSLRRQHVDAVVAWARAELAAGNAQATIEPLSDLVDDHPLTESLWAVLIRAMHAEGRQAEALERYAAAARHLADELGVDPGAELEGLHRALLRGDLDQPTPPAGSTAVTPVRPAQLPADVRGFTGRGAELAQLDAIPAEPGTRPPGLTVAVVSGTAGVGKTALAVHAAHRIADHYPDGQLFIDLHGYTQGIAQIAPAEALDHMLRALGIPGTQIPASLDQRAALYRSRLADQQMLIVLDNAATEAQVQPLLPGNPGCLVLVTSRHRLAGLDQTHALSLDTLPVPDAVTLLLRATGEDRLASQPPELLTELAETCGRLPLAVRIAAARLRSHPAWHLSDLMERLRDQQHRLGELTAGPRSVTAALDLSYQHLSPDQQQAYRLMGLHPGPEFDPYAATALLDSTVLHAGRVLDQLLEAHLLQEPTPGRYRFHDLTRAHAAHTAISDQTTPAGAAALGRLLDYYRHTAATAMDAAYAYEREHRPQVPPAPTPSPELPDPAAALAWLDTELPNLLAAARSAIEYDRPAHLLHLSTILHRHLRTRGPYDAAETLHQQALTTASASGDREGQLNTQVSLGDIHLLRGRYEEAIDHFEQALQIARATGYRPGELNALNGLGRIYLRQGRHDQAADHYQQALQVARVTGHRPGELTALSGLGHIHLLQSRYVRAADRLGQALQIARATGHRDGELTALSGLGRIYLRQGRHEAAADHVERALQIARATGNRPAEQAALNGLAQTHLRQGRHEAAAGHVEQALQIARATGHRFGELNALSVLGDLQLRQGRHGQAADHYQRLLDLAHASGDRSYEFEAWQGFGRLRHAADDFHAAIAHHERALALAGELSQPDDQARAHDGLAQAHDALNQHEPARTHWQHALKLLAGIGIDHTDGEETTTAAIRDRLAKLD